MVSEKYACAYKEVIEVLKCTNREDVLKIPSYKILMYLKYMNKNYNFKIDETKTLEEQNLLDETKAILANLYKDYWASNYQKQRINAKEQYDNERSLVEDYSSDEIFKNKNKTETGKIQINEEIKMVVVEDKWYRRIFNKIMNILKH